MVRTRRSPLPLGGLTQAGRQALDNSRDPRVGSLKRVPIELPPNVRVHYPEGYLVGPSVTADGEGDGVAGGRHLVAAAMVW